MKTLFLLLFGLILCHDANSQWLEGGRKQEQTVQGNGAILYHEGKLYTFNETMFISRSDDNGATWIDLSDSGLPPKGPGLAKHIKTLSASNSRIYGGMNFGNGTGMPVFSSDMGETWNQDTLGAPGHALGWDGLPAVSDIFAWGNWLYVKWDAPSAYDIKVIGGPYIRNTFLAIGGNNPYGRCAKGDTLFISSTKFFYSIDGGVTWITPANNGYTLGTKLFVDGHRIYMTVGGSYASPFKFYYTDDNGENWSSIDVGDFGKRKEFGGLYYTPTAYFIKGNNIWVAVGQDHLDSPPNIWRSTDLGLTWATDTAGIPKSYVNGVTGFAYSNDGTLWCVPSYQEIFKQKIDAGTGGGNNVTVAPDLLIPPDMQQVSGINTTLVWGKVANATKYHLQVASDASFTALIVDDATLTDTSKVISSLAANSTFYWRVSGISSNGQSGPWAGMRSFITMASGVALESSTSISIAPNPATSHTQIYSKENTVMSVSIRNPLGLEVMTTTTSGALDIHSLSSGVYFLTITANGKSETLKLIKQ